MSAYAGSLHTICRVVFWVFRFDQILVIALYFALHFDQIPSCTQYRRNLFYFQASNEFQPFFNTDQLSCRPSTKEIPEGRQGNVPEHYLRGNVVCRFNGESRLPPYALRKFFGKGYGFVRGRGKWNGAPRFPFQCTGIYSRTPHPGPPCFWRPVVQDSRR